MPTTENKPFRSGLALGLAGLLAAAAGLVWLAWPQNSARPALPARPALVLDSSKIVKHGVEGRFDLLSVHARSSRS